MGAYFVAQSDSKHLWSERRRFKSIARTERAVYGAGQERSLSQDWLWEFYGISIAFAMRSFDRSLFTHLLDFYRGH